MSNQEELETLRWQNERLREMLAATGEELAVARSLLGVTPAHACDVLIDCVLTAENADQIDFRTFAVQGNDCWEVTVQRKGGATPAQMIQALRQQVAELQLALTSLTHLTPS